MIEIEGRCRFEAYLERHRAATRSRRWFVRLVTGLAGVAVIATGPAAVAFPVGLFLLLWATFLSDLFFRARVRRRWNRDPSLRDGA
ncbi:MAG: hypothetical protein ACYTGC_00695 [Planctomycetota bacterium]|jgi:uncharacterized protein (DUF58 family)